MHGPANKSKNPSHHGNSRPVLRHQEPQGMVDAVAHSDQDIAVPVSAIVKSSDEEECEEEWPLPDLEKDDMHARRTGAFQKAAGPAFNSFLPVPGSVRHKSAPVSAAVDSTYSKPVEQGKIPPSERSGKVFLLLCCKFFTADISNVLQPQFDDLAFI